MCIVSGVCVHRQTHTQSEGAGSYHVRVRLQHKASLFPPLLSVVVLKHITQTLQHKVQVRTGGWMDGRMDGWKDGRMDGWMGCLHC